MIFREQLDNIRRDELLHEIVSKTWRDVEQALAHPGSNIGHLLALISPAAVPYLEDMASLSRELTRKRFGNTIQLYVPLYLSNECSNSCLYCGFNKNNLYNRVTLTTDQILAEARVLKQQGFEHILFVTGESKHASFDYIRQALNNNKNIFSLLSIEVQPLSTNEYHILSSEGLNTVYLYQETYNRELYAHYHPAGPKSDYNYRIDTYERMGEAGLHRMGLGVLLGLDDWRTETCFLAMHIAYLRRKYWKTKYSVSVPRFRGIKGSFQPPYTVNDQDLIQMICALRIFDENLEISLSTRESINLRNHAVPLGITSMSAGSRTSPGGYTCLPASLEQFEVHDNRTPDEIQTMIRNNGYEPVWKDWDIYMQQEA